MALLRFVCLIVFCVILNFNGLSTTADAEEGFPISLIHINDFHARYEATNDQGGACKNANCIGGFSRIYRVINNILEVRRDSIDLNAGDNFQGTIWYNLFKWNVTQYFMNKLPFDAVVLGNHEFDDGVEGVIPFIKSLNAPVVVANIDDSLEPDIQGIYRKSVVIERNGNKIGIIGVILKNCNEIANTGNLKFHDESESVNAEAERLVREEGVFTNIVLSHSGYDVEQEIAKKATPQSKIIVKCATPGDPFLPKSNSTFWYQKVPVYQISARSYTQAQTRGERQAAFQKWGHSSLQDLGMNVNLADPETIFLAIALDYLAPVPGPDIPSGPYPTIVQRSDGKQVLVVQASAYSRYVGNLTVNYDEQGDVLNWDGKPIFLGTDFPQDEMINEDLKPWKAEADVLGTKVLGKTLVTLDQTVCRYAECLLGNFVTDAMVYSYITPDDSSWTHAALAVTNPGGLRTTIEKGDITFNDMITSQPFENTLDVGEIDGEYLKEMFEFSTTPYFYGRAYANVNLLQVSGFHLVYNLSRPAGSRLLSIKVRCNDCTVPIYEDLKLNQTYRLIVPSFLRNGGDGFTVIRDNLKNVSVGRVDIDVYQEYLAKKSPIFEEIEGRIEIIGEDSIQTRNLYS